MFQGHIGRLIIMSNLGVVKIFKFFDDRKDSNFEIIGKHGLANASQSTRATRPDEKCCLCSTLFGSQNRSKEGSWTNFLVLAL